MSVKLPMNIDALMKKADKLFQRARVMQEVDEYGFGLCITCIRQKRIHHTELDGGHFIGKGLGGAFLAVRYEPNNCFPQCRSCNRFQQGNHAIYRDRLIEKVGLDEVLRLEKKKYEPVIFVRSLLEEVIEKYRKVK